MSAEVIKFRPKDYANNPDAVLEDAVGDFETVIVLGWDKDGNLDFRGSTGDPERIVFLIETFKLRLLSGDFMDD